jgi:hypothetical protein
MRSGADAEGDTRVSTLHGEVGLQYDRQVMLGLLWLFAEDGAKK